ncbi:MAG: TetR/AcrR family transcriptional regulator [Actinomycetota bacterium]|nr:TetR/AcrR family transcriptional regulator [Actinomycetota bacterium]
MASAPAATKPGPGRPPTGARERILDACLDVLKSDGYAGLSLAKVAAASGQNKALITYHFGSKSGLVKAAARELGDSISRQILQGLEGASTVEDIVRGALTGVWEIVAGDERLPRVYFDLSAVSVVDEEIRAVMREVKDGFRAVLRELLGAAGDPLPAPRIPAFSVMLIAGIEGLLLERIERGESTELSDARELFVRSMIEAAGPIDQRSSPRSTALI